MKDRVREAVFNLLGDVSGRFTIDLFAGTGALGFEALSRGAQAAVFVEQHFPTADVLRKNATSLGLNDRCEVLAADTLVWFRREIRLPKSLPDVPWLVFCSPPYELFVSRKEALVHLLSELWQAAPPGSAFVVEADRRFDFALLPEPGKWLLRDYPPAHIGLAWKAEQA
jgi:16S rRNA (guanine966-N2)-methyltransferase